ncbi:hypothetical protein FJT64_015102 [Amphibalanus amphitrite]|uniref:Uncharacterized protein n=1 Tax=Amphibalanus amphitrite TaxID=1232801 RepID=A0A6A4X5A0_AMPAM|nr:hypothetical protein FJT64_015102 [Amphibalanus amphitrite]
MNHPVPTQLAHRLNTVEGAVRSEALTELSNAELLDELKADCQRLLLARTSTVKLDEALRRAAETVGGSAPRLVARFRSSVNRDFHNIAGRELREAGKFHHDPQTGAEVRAHSLARSERDYSAYDRRKRITGFVADLRQAFMMSEDGQAFSWFTMANKTLGTYGAALVVVTKTVQEALTYFVQHLRHLIVTELPKNADSQRLLVAARTSTAVLDRVLKAAADVVGGVAPHLVARFKNSMNRAFHNIQASDDYYADREMREAGALRQSAGTASEGQELREAGKFHHDPQTGAEVRAHSLARSERDYSAYGRRKRITGFVVDLRQAFMMSEDGQAFSWFTMANKTLGTYGAALVVVTKTIQEALTYFVQHLRHLIVAELPKIADSQRLLVAARTSTDVLDRALKAAADVVGGVAPHLVARFKNSMNRAFHNIQASDDYYAMSEDGQAFSWFTMANKTLGTYGAALVLVTKTIQGALTYFVQHLRHLIVTELPKNADSQRPPMMEPNRLSKTNN